MRSGFKWRPSPAMVVALIALFVALGGGAYAALSLPRGSVGTAQLHKGAVTGAKLHANAVTSRKVKDHSLLARDLRPGSVGAAQLAAPQPWRTVGEPGQPGFQDGWGNARLGSSFTLAGFMKDQDGVVHLRGQIKGGIVTPTVDATVFTLPLGYRPLSGERYFPVLTTDGANHITPGWVDVDPNGEVFVGVGDNHFVTLDNISFRP